MHKSIYIKNAIMLLITTNTQKTHYIKHVKCYNFLHSATVSCHLQQRTIAECYNKIIQFYFLLTHAPLSLSSCLLQFASLSRSHLLPLDSHMSPISPNYIDSDLNRCFQALKKFRPSSSSIVPQSQSQSHKSTNDNNSDLSAIFTPHPLEKHMEVEDPFQSGLLFLDYCFREMFDD